MKKFGFATLAAGAALIGLAASAVAAPSAVTNAQATISSLEAQGFHVVVNRLSERPLSEADVVSVGNGSGFTSTAWQSGSATPTTVYVDVR